MKWAPNKKLHFEVAIIRAIQSLGQATLDEVIERLSELRDGGRARPPGAPPTKPAAAGSDRGNEGSRPQKAGITDPGYSKAETTRVAETAVQSQPNADELWQKVLAKIPAKGFLRTLSESIRPIGIDGRNFLLGHSPDDQSKVEALASPNNRRQLETLLREASGRDWSVKFVAKEGILPQKAFGVLSGEVKSAELFKDDPLIQEAIEIFKAQIKS